MPKQSKKLSTKELKGRRVNGVLYLDRGVGSGCFLHVNYSGTSGSESFTETDHILPSVKKKSNEDDY